MNATVAAPSPSRSRPAGPVRTAIPHVAAFDGLRGAAVAAVLAHHAGHLEGGWLGVDLFFVLSGYLITALLLSGWRTDGRVALGAFWARRVRRLGPALVVTLVAVAAYGAFVARPDELLAIRWDGLATLFEVANWRTVATSGDYFARTQRPSPLQHTWSLAIEEQLYLLWPLVVAAVLAWRRRPLAVLVVATAGAATSAALMVGLHAAGAPQSRLYHGTDTRASAVLLGAALAAGRLVLGPERWARTRPVRAAAGILAAAALAVAWARLDGATDLPYRGALPLAGLAGALVVAAVADRRHPGPLGAVLRVRPLRELGRISYGAYLYHWPLYLLLDQERTGLSGWALVTVRVAATLAAAAVSARFLEEPVRRGTLLTGRPARAAVPAAIAFASLALFAGTLGAVTPPSADRVANDVDRSSVAGAPTVLLAGDSVPLIMGFELTERRDEFPVSVANQALPGCHLLASVGPIRGVEGRVRDDVRDCAAEGAYRAGVREAAPSVSMVLFGEFPNEAVRVDGRWAMPCQARYLDLLRRRLDALVDDLRSTGTPVVLVTAPGSTISWILERVPPGMDDRVSCSNQVLVDLAEARPGVSVVDLAAFVCPPGEPCQERVDGVDLRPDGLHFSGDGAAYVNRWLIPRVLDAVEET